MVDEAPLMNSVGFPIGNISMEGILSGVVDGLSVDDAVGHLLVGMGGGEGGLSIRSPPNDKDLSLDALVDRHLHHGVGALRRPAHCWEGTGVLDFCFSAESSLSDFCQSFSVTMNNSSLLVRMARYFPSIVRYVVFAGIESSRTIQATPLELRLRMMETT